MALAVALASVDPDRIAVEPEELCAGEPFGVVSRSGRVGRASAAITAAGVTVHVPALHVDAPPECWLPFGWIEAVTGALASVYGGGGFRLPLLPDGPLVVVVARPRAGRILLRAVADKCGDTGLEVAGEAELGHGRHARVLEERPAVLWLREGPGAADSPPIRWLEKRGVKLRRGHAEGPLGTLSAVNHILAGRIGHRVRPIDSSNDCLREGDPWITGTW